MREFICAFAAAMLLSFGAMAATVTVPSRTEFPAGMRITSDITATDGVTYKAGSTLPKAILSGHAVKVEVDTKAPGVTHVPGSFAGFIFFKDVR